MIKPLHILLGVICICAACPTLAQQDRKLLQKNTLLGLTSDSLSGYDEQTYRQEAQQHGVSASETELYVEFTKREFIKRKYNLYPSTETGTLNKVATPVCTNEDFEDYSFTYSIPNTINITTINGINGWTCTKNSVSGSTSACSIPTTSSSIAPDAISVIAPGATGLTDALIGSSYPIYSVFGYFPNNGGLTASGDTMSGEWFIKINDQSPGFGLSRISKTINITASNALFKFAFIALVQGSHCCCDSPGFDLTFKDCSNNVLPIPTYTIAPPQAAGCVGGVTNCLSSAVTASMFTCPMNSGWKYNPWNVNAVDLSAYIGTCVTIEVTAVDCPYGGHAGYCYFDAQCGASLVTGISSTERNADIRLFPNPNSGDFILNIEKSLTKGEIVVENMLGQIIYKQIISEGENRIQLKNIAPGIYNYSITGNKKIIGKGKLAIE